MNQHIYSRLSKELYLRKYLNIRYVCKRLSGLPCLALIALTTPLDLVRPQGLENLRS